MGPRVLILPKLLLPRPWELRSWSWGERVAKVRFRYSLPLGSYWADSFLVDGSANLRELVRTMHWDLPTDGPKTLNGLIVEHLESLPETGTSLMIAGYPIEVVQTQDNAVKTARIRPGDRRQRDED